MWQFADQSKMSPPGLLSPIRLGYFAITDEVFLYSKVVSGQWRAYASAPTGEWV